MNTTRMINGPELPHTPDDVLTFHYIHSFIDIFRVVLSYYVFRRDTSDPWEDLVVFFSSVVMIILSPDRCLILRTIQFYLMTFC